ncbi:MAG: PA0069 family radical SAM protein [Gammaproteobacteria bacterium]
MCDQPPAPIRGRGAATNPPGRHAVRHAESPADEPQPPATQLHEETCRSIISRNRSPDVPFEQSLNPYRGCEHGCIYCYARPSHSWLDLSPGLDFETRIFVKGNAAERLRETLASPRYRPRPITIGANTDPYQPTERSRRITRSVLEVLAEHAHPFSIITKSSLIERDLDLLAALAARRLCSVAISIPTLDDELKRTLEPRVPSARRRLTTIERLSGAGVPVTLMLAPVIPALTDHEIEDILAAAAAAGASRATWVLLRLPHEVAPLFREWLRTHHPDRADRVMSLIRQARGGRDYDASWGRRQRGTGQYAAVIARRFEVARRRCGYRTDAVDLDTSRFARPGQSGQLDLAL